MRMTGSAIDESLNISTPLLMMRAKETRRDWPGLVYRISSLSEGSRCHIQVALCGRCFWIIVAEIDVDYASRRLVVAHGIEV